MKPSERIHEAAARLRTGDTTLSCKETHIELAPGTVREAMAVHDTTGKAELTVEAGRGACLRLTELFTGEGTHRTLRIRQQAESRVEVLLVQLGPSVVDCTVDLEGAHAECRIDGLFLTGKGERTETAVRTNHRAADCRSESVVKGVAGAGGTGTFRGLVYVAAGAQRTDARQTSRNIEAGEGARIVAEPQLEIYADNVQCSHGATVGQLDSEAVFYMRQRGLDERQARRLQIEGFAADVVNRCASEPLHDELTALISDKLETL